MDLFDISLREQQPLAGWNKLGSKVHPSAAAAAAAATQKSSTMSDVERERQGAKARHRIGSLVKITK